MTSVYIQNYQFDSLLLSSSETDITAVHGVMGSGQKRLYASVAVPPASVWFPSNGPLPRVSRLSANGKGDNETIPGAAHRTPGIYFKAEENPGS